MRALIFANGTLNGWPQALEPANEQDLLVCADGGLYHCLRLGLTPQLVVGDMDSVSAADLAALPPEVEVIRHPARKDQTDLELALLIARQRGAEQIFILGALGMRWDMSLANVLLLASDAALGGAACIVEQGQLMFCLKGPHKQALPGRPGDLVSLLPLGHAAVGVTLYGMEYPLQNATLELGTTWGISNLVHSSPALVQLEKGILLVILSSQTD